MKFKQMIKSLKTFNTNRKQFFHKVLLPLYDSKPYLSLSILLINVRTCMFTRKNIDYI